MSRSNSRTFDWDTPNSRTASREFLHGSRSTAAIMASSVADVTEHVGDMKSQVSECYTACLTKTLLQSWTHIHVSMTSTTIICELPCVSNNSTVTGTKVEEMSQYSSCVFSTIIPLQLHPAVRQSILLSTPNNVLYRHDT